MCTTPQHIQHNSTAEAWTEKGVDLEKGIRPMDRWVDGQWVLLYVLLLLRRGREKMFFLYFASFEFTMEENGHQIECHCYTRQRLSRTQDTRASVYVYCVPFTCKLIRCLLCIVWIFQALMWNVWPVNHGKFLCDNIAAACNTNLYTCGSQQRHCAALSLSDAWECLTWMTVLCTACGR